MGADHISNAHKPSPESVSATKLQSLIGDIDILLVTTTPVERDAVLARLDQLPGEKAVLEGSIGPITMRLGHFGRYYAAHVECSMGSVGRDASALTLADAIDVIKPKAILIIGIAFGRNRQTQSFGDVIVAEEVIPYEPARVGITVESRGRSILAGTLLQERFRTRHGDWTERRGRRRVKVFCGPMLSGEKLIDNIAERDDLFAKHPRAIGGEMEAAGAYAAANRKSCEILLVKAISDFADGKKAKTKDKQSFAASMAVSLALHILSKPDVLGELNARDQGLPDEPKPTGINLSPRDRLVEGIDVLPQAWAGRIRSFIDAYTGTIERPNVFCGRDEDVEQLVAWLDRQDVPPNLLVTAPAGRGKSALLVRLAMRLDTHDDVDVAFIPWSARYDTNRPDVFLGSLIARIARLRQRNPPDLKHANAEILEKMLHDELETPHTQGRKLIIMLDGLDEAVGFHIQSSFLPPSHSESIRIIVSARHRPDDPKGDLWIRDLGWVGPRIADRLLLYPLEIRDVETALKRLPSPLDSLSFRHEIVSEIHRLCVADPLTLWLMVIDILALGERALNLDVSELRARPPGLAGYFEDWWKHQRTQWKGDALHREKSAYALLELLAVAEGRLIRDDVLALLHEEIPNGVSLNDTLQDLSRLIEGDGKTNGYVLAHPGFGQYWREQMGKQACQKWQKRIANWIEQVTDDFFTERLSANEVPRYAVQHRVNHLKQQGASKERWMSLATRQWYDVWQVHETGPSGFLDDVNTAWKTIAVDGGHFAEEAQCALVRGSIGSTLAQITPELLKLLLDEGIWSPEQAFAYVRAAPATTDSHNGRGKLMETLIPYLSDAFLPEIFKVACDLEEIPFESLDENVFLDILKRVAIAAPTDARIALERIQSPNSRSLRLTMLAEHLPAQARETVLRHSLELARQVKRPFPRVYLLRDIAEKMKQPERGLILQEAFAAADEIKELRERLQRYCELMPLLPDDLRSKAFAQALATAVASCEDSDHPLHGLESLIVQVSAPFREQAVATLETIVRTRKTQPGGWYTCLKIISCIPEDQHGHWVELAFSIINLIDDDGERAKAIIGTLDFANKTRGAARQAVVNHGLQLADKAQSPWSCLEILGKLRDHVPNEVLWRVAEPTWPSIVNCLRSEDSLYEHFVFDEILDIAPLDMALNAVTQSPYPWVRAELLIRLGKRLPMEERSSLMAQAFDDIGKLALARKRADLHKRLLFNAPEHQRDSFFNAMVKSIDEIAEPYLRTLKLMDLVHMLNEPWRTNAVNAALTSARNIAMPHARFDQLLHIAGHTTADQRNAFWQEAFDTAMLETQPWLRRNHIIALAKAQQGQRRHELLRMALDLSRAIGDETKRVQATLSFARHLPPEEMNTLVDDIERIPRADQRFEKYLLLFVDCPMERSTRFDLAVAAARLAGRETGNHGWGSWLVRLVPFASRDRREPLLREVLTLARDQLNSLARPPPEARLEDQYADHSGITIDGEVCASFQQIAAWLPNDLLLEALSIASQFGNFHHRTQATIALAMHLPEIERIKIGESILAANVPLSHHSSRKEVRNGVARNAAHLFPEPRRSEMLAKFSSPNESGVSVQVHQTEDPARLDTEELDKLFATVEAEQTSGSPHDARLVRLGALAAERMRRRHPPRDKFKKLLHDTLVGRSETRANALMVLSAMAPLIVELGGQEAAVGVVNAIRQVGKWWA